MDVDSIKKLVRNVPDFPKPGIQFKDITPVLQHPAAFKAVIDELSKKVGGRKFDTIISIESRGFILGAALAYSLGKGFVPLRKPGKLPYNSVRAVLEKEYGKDALEMHVDAVKKGERVLIVDDVLATGGTLNAAIELVEGQSAVVDSVLVLAELKFLEGRRKIKGSCKSYEVFSLIEY